MAITNARPNRRLNVAREITALRRMTVAELRERHMDVFGEPTRSGNKDYLVKRIAWRMQANAHGGLSDRARTRAAELAREADLRTTAPKGDQTADEPGKVTESTTGSITRVMDHRLPPPGTVVTRVYKGQTIEVTVRPDGFEFDGAIYRSLSAVARAVTGAHQNGFAFFRLRKDGDT